MPTIYDIAKAVGTSAATVSKALNNYKDVSPKTKEKVLAMAKEMGYIPNLTARSLKTNRSYLVGVVFSEDMGIGLEHQFFSVVLENFRQHIGKYGYDTVFINNTLGTNKIGYLDHCKYRHVDGVFIITTHPGDVDVNKLVKSKIKCVTTDIVLENTPSIISENREGSILAIKHFYENGHRRIGHIGGQQNSIAGAERYEGYKQGLEELGLEYNEEYFIESSGFQYDVTYDIALEYLERFSKETIPTAIYVASDLMAIATIRALENKGYGVPEDVSIIGFDDISLAEYSRPALTTIRQKKDLIGIMVADTLVKSIESGALPKGIIRMPVELVVRDTVKNIEVE
ncbi:MAG: LacI family DNA-binding transcriptional regulator [Clostridia bacterium]|nr:LacI family DNA-binding transcriptional regulator [Clostridia bacterium]